MYQKAYEKYASGNYEEALSLVTECKKQLRKKSYLYKNNHDRLDEEISIRMFEGKILLKLGNIEDAEQIYNDVQTRLQSVNNKSRISAEAYYYLSEIAEKQQNQSKQWELLEKAKDAFIEADLYAEAVDIMFDLAETMVFEDGKEGMINHYREIIEIAKQIDEKDLSRFQTAKSRLRIGYLSRNGDPKVASQFLILAQKDFDRLNHDAWKYRSLVHLAGLKSLTDLSRGIEILENIKSEINEEDAIYPVILLKLCNYFLRIGEKEQAMDYYKQVNPKLNSIPMDVSHANALLEAAKSFILISDSDTMYNTARSLSARAIEIYDHLDQKLGKAISYLLEGIATFMVHKKTGDNSKLKLVHFLARKSENTISFEFEPWVIEMIKYVGDAELSVEEVISKMRIHDDIPTMLQNAEILHLLGLYKLSSTDHETAKSFLISSKSLYEKSSPKTGNFLGIEDHIDQLYATVPSQ